LSDAAKDIEQGSRAFAGALAFVGIICIAYPLADLLLNNWPLQPGDLAWRYQLVGMLSQLLITPLIGVAFLAGSGLLKQGGGYLRWGGIVSFGTGAIVLLLTLVFILDGLQLKNLIEVDEVYVFQRSTIRAVAKNVISSAGFLYVGYGAWKAGREMSARGVDPGKDKNANPSAIVMKSEG